MAKLLISMRDEFLKKVDDFAATEHRTRSELVRQALREYINLKRSSATVIVDPQPSDYVHGGRFGD